MRKRPTNTFLCVMRKEDPSDKKKMIDIFKKGGMQIENNWKCFFGDMKNTFPYVAETSKNKAEYGNWLYVGETWWCRKTKKYEFARLVAVEKKDNKISGLWDVRRHNPSKPLCWVYKEGKRGVIISHNSYEINVSWESSIGRNIIELLHSLDGVTFEFEEDFRKYTKIASSLKHG